LWRRAVHEGGGPRLVMQTGRALCSKRKQCGCGDLLP
jgi:hypothetical protein